MNTTNSNQRRKHVDQMRANFAIEDMRPDAADVALQQQYIAGTVTLDAMLQHARAFALAHAPRAFAV